MATANTGMGAGTQRQELERWLRDAGKVTVFDEGEQHQLFDSRPVRVYRLFNSKGESITMSSDTAESYGYRPTTRPCAPPPRSAGLFGGNQGFMFNEEV